MSRQAMLGQTDSRPANLELRDYQIKCLQQISAGMERGVRRQLVALPTGTGKTVIFSQLPRLRPRQRSIVIAHREELIEQAAEKISWANPSLGVDIEMASSHASQHADVVVGSIQTLSGRHGIKRLARLEPGSFGTVIIDEVHHALARIYLEFLAHFGLAPDVSDLAPGAALTKSRANRIMAERFERFRLGEAAPLLVGFTATPHRTDGLGLQYILDEITFSRTIKEMMTAPAPGPWLCGIKGYRFESGIDLSKVKTRGGDFQESDLGLAVNNDEWNVPAVKAYLAMAPGRPAICFCVNVEHTRAMTAKFQEYGIRADCVLGEVGSFDRRQVIQDFKAGKLDVLVNCMVLTEGFDHAPTSCIIMARPTKSQLLYTQMLGRGTRLAPGKEDLLVIDLAGAGQAGVANVNTLFGLPPRLSIKDGLLEAEAEFQQVMAENPVDTGLLDTVETLDDVKKMAREFNPLESARMPEDIDHDLTWVKTAYGYALGVGNLVTIGVVLDMLDHAQVQMRRRSQGSYATKTEVLGNYNSAQEAIAAMEVLVSEDYPTEAFWLNRKTGWRKRAGGQPATPKQLNFLRKKKIPFPESLSKADASTLISKALSGSFEAK